MQSGASPHARRPAASSRSTVMTHGRPSRRRTAWATTLTLFFIGFHLSVDHDYVADADRLELLVEVGENDGFHEPPMCVLHGRKAMVPPRRAWVNFTPTTTPATVRLPAVSIIRRVRKRAWRSHGGGARGDV